MLSAFSSAARRAGAHRQQLSLSLPSPSADRLAVVVVATALSFQLLDAALQPLNDASDSTSSLIASDGSSHKLVIDALRRSHFIECDVAQTENPGQLPLIMTDEEIASVAVSKLNKTGFLVIPGVFTGPALASCRDQAASLMLPDSEGTIVAKPGHGSDDAINREMLLRWVRPERGTAGTSTSQQERGGLQSAIALVRSVPSFVEGPLNGYDRSKAHIVPNVCRLAVMPGTGATYRPHRDATIYSIWELGIIGWLKARGYQRRVLTSILYLNEEEWSNPINNTDSKPDGNGKVGADTVGGCLRLHPDADPTDCVGETSTHVDVIPNGGTLVIFDATDVLHEVLPTFRDRLTITSWVVGDHRA